MKRLLIVLPLSVAGTIVLFVGAAMHGGMCHCMTAMFALFPYGTFLAMRTSWEAVGWLVTLIQFPLYAVIIAMARGARGKTIALLLIIAAHVLASFAVSY